MRRVVVHASDGDAAAHDLARVQSGDRVRDDEPGGDNPAPLSDDSPVLYESAGVMRPTHAPYTPEDQDVKTPLTQADPAMCHAKRAGRNQLSCFAP